MPAGAAVGAGASSAGPSNGPGGPVSSAPPSTRTDIRQAALQKYREKRKARDSNAASKIRYQSRKVLAEARPRVRGQFVRVKKEGEVEATSDGKLLGDSNADALAGTARSGPYSFDEEKRDLSAGDQPPSAEEAMEYDCHEEDMSDGGDEEPSAGAPAEAEIGCGVAEMHAEPAPTTDGPDGPHNAAAAAAVGGNGRRMTRSQVAGGHAAGASHQPQQLTGHKHRRQAPRRESTPGPLLENTSGDLTKNVNGGSDSGSNSPQEELSLPEMQTMAPPAKQQHR